MADRQIELDGLNDEAQALKPTVARSNEAKAILDNPMVKDALDEITDALTTAITKSKLDQSQVREDSYRMLRLLDMFKGHFERHLRNGELATANLARIRDRRKFLMNVDGFLGRRADR